MAEGFFNTPLGQLRVESLRAVPRPSGSSSKLHRRALLRHEMPSLRAGQLVISSPTHGSRMLTLIRDATVITGDAERTVLYDACVAVDGRKIIAVGPSDEIASRHPDANVVDGRRKAVFPGFVNAHTHLLATTDRGILEDFGFPTTLRFPVSARALLTPDERNIMALLGTVEAIRSGTTCLLEISDNISDYAASLESTGLRLGLAEHINDIADEAGGRQGVFEYSEERMEAGLQRSQELIEGWHGRSEGRVRCVVAPHAPETCSPELLRGSRQLAERYGTRCTIHLAQSHYEVEAVMRTRRVRPTQYLLASGLLGPDLIAAHCRYVDASEIALLGHARVGVSNNAAIAARRGAAAPIQELEAAGCTIGAGSDNMAEDMVEALRAGLFLERVRRNDEMRPQPEDVLEWGDARRRSHAGSGAGDWIARGGQKGGPVHHKRHVPAPGAESANRLVLHPQRAACRRH